MPLHHDADLDAEFGENAHDEAQFDIHLTIFIALDGADQGLGELVAHIAGHRHRARHSETHHAGGQDKGPAGTDETAYQAADKADDE